LFLIESGLLGAVGGLLGILFGVGIAKLISVLGTVLLDTDLLKASVPLSLALVAFLFSFVIGSVSGILPALRASRLPPVEALRKVA
jgi:putative ABC transport system permease protein